MAFFSLEIEIRLKQDESTILVCLICMKRKHLQTFKSRSCKNLLLQCVRTGKTYFDEHFLFYLMIGRHYFLAKDC